MDERDRKIISILQKNGRATLSEISGKIGISSMGVKKRIDKLQKNKLVKVKALLNTKKLDVITAVVAMEVESAEAIEKLIERFKECPRIIRFFITTGGFNLFALIWAEDFHSLESVSLEKCSLRSQEGVRRFEVFPIQEIQYDSFLDLSIVPEKVGKNAPCGVYCGDCHRYEEHRCLGCPATKFYRGKL